MTTSESSEYDLLGRITSSTDVLGRVTTYAYSEDGLTTTQTTPSGATFVTRNAPDGTVLEESGTGSAHIIYSLDLVADGVRTFTKAVSGETETELQRSVANGAGEILRTGRPNTIGGVIYTRNTYNAKGQLTKEQTDAETAATTMAPTLWEYDDFGNKVKETWKLADPATVSNSRITTWSYGVEQAQDGVYRVVTATRNNGQGTTYGETQKTLVSSPLVHAGKQNRLHRSQRKYIHTVERIRNRRPADAKKQHPHFQCHGHRDGHRRLYYHADGPRGHYFHADPSLCGNRHHLH